MLQIRNDGSYTGQLYPKFVLASASCSMTERSSPSVSFLKRLREDPQLVSTCVASETELQNVAKHARTPELLSSFCYSDRCCMYRMLQLRLVPRQ
jgi:hypothetical protein